MRKGGGFCGSFAVLAGYAAAVFLGAGGCSPAPSSQSFDSESVLTGECAAPRDQRGSFMAKVMALPLLIRADAGFTDDERASIGAAVAQWNLFGRRVRGADFFSLEFDVLPANFHADDPRDCSNESFGTEAVFSIVRESAPARWRSLGFTDSIPGATLRCYSGKQVLHQVVMTYINVVDPAQFTSVILHELGHTLGLDHSCQNGAAREKFAACAGLAESHPYHMAVMFPSLRMRSSVSEQPEVKNVLRSNDELRASCLYGGEPESNQ